MNLYTINTGYFKLDGGAMFGVVPKSIWSKTNPVDSNNLVELAMRALLVESGDRLILIDTGIGDKQSERFFSYYSLYGDTSINKALAEHGFSEDDITDVFLTHLHLDHVGGAVKRIGDALLPTFPNAKYWTNKQHWDWAMNPNEREKASFLEENLAPLADSGVLHFVQPDGANPFPEHFTTRFVHGHTDAMMLPQLLYKGRTLVFAADLIPTVSHIPVAYVPAYDVYPLKSMDEKKAFLQEALENDYILFFEHDAYIECCTLKMTEKGVRADETFKLADLK